MSDEKSDRYIDSLERRITEHDHKLSLFQRDISESTHELKEVLNRINNGVSPSVNEVRRENAEIKLSIAEMSHKLDLATAEMKAMSREMMELSTIRFKSYEAQIEAFENGPLADNNRKVGRLEKLLVYGPLLAMIIYFGQLGVGSLWKKMFAPDGTPLAIQATSTTKKPLRK